MRRIRVLVVDDSLTVRGQLREVLGADPELEVVGEAEDGKRAIELVQLLRPDVITMDMIMPVMSGVATTEYIMAHCPTPILIVSSSTNRGELFKTYDALAAGAVDVLDKAAAADAVDAWERQLVSTVKLVSRIKVITHPRGRLRAITAPPRRLGPGGPPELFAIGASTGGPGALVDILRALPAGLGVPVALVLHINEPFGTAFAEWLDGQTHHRVGFARDGDALDSKRIVMAPPDKHLVVERGRYRLTMEPPRHSCRPSVDVLFESIARSYGAGAVAALLTGMWRDGAAGLLQIRTAGGHTIAQDEASSIVYGMPREAALLGAVERVASLSQVGPLLAELFTSRGGPA
jgi:two-component system, chemotaxis family, protein-glutamate methylesterase/glutaminase